MIANRGSEVLLHILTTWKYLILGLAVALPTPLHSQRQADLHGDAPEAVAVLLTAAVVVDGSVDEPGWSGVPATTGFTQIQPLEGAPASQLTEIRLAYDREALYVGAILYSDRPVSTRLARRDQHLPDSDWLAISLDTQHDHATAYRLMVNPSGVRVDAAVTDGAEDYTWDPVWEVETWVGDAGWSVEMRIPFTQLRFGRAEEQVWGIQIEREIAALQERVQFSFVPRRESGGVPRYGHLRGLRGIPRGRGVDVLPYLVARTELAPLEHEGDTPFGDPYRDGSELSSGAGVDVKLRLASNLTVDATVNPDFGQVEVDPAVINLTQYETRFDEKRPFFTEGAGIFAFGEDLELLHSRRIGEVPSWSPSGDTAYQESPSAATILGAARLTGRSAGGWSIGLLEAVTARERGRYVDRAGGHHAESIAPLTSFTVGRIHRSLDEDRSSFGGLITAVNRDLGEVGLNARLVASAFTGGIDFRQRWADNAWSVSGHLAGSRVRGEPAAIAALQRSSARYFQRPDAEHLELDPHATELSGYAATLRLTKHSGLHWRGRALVAGTSPGFEINDAGFQSSADRVGTHVRLQYVEEQPGRTLREWRISGGPDLAWNFGGDRIGNALSAEANAQLLSYWTGEVRLDRSFEALDDRRTRGGPLTRAPTGSRVYLAVESDERKSWTLSIEADRRWDEAGASADEVAMGLSVHPAERWSLTLEPRLERSRETAHFLGSVADVISTSTYGRRFLFAGLEETRVAVEARLNLTFSPGLTLELFAQPFLAAAKYSSPKELDAPATFSFSTYGTEIGEVVREGDVFLIDPDGPGPARSFEMRDESFSNRSLRGNAVLRWEWRPGSTLFLVWQQSRSGRDAVGDFSFDRQARDLWAATPSNTLMLKVTYWFGR